MNSGILFANSVAAVVGGMFLTTVAAMDANQVQPTTWVYQATSKLHQASLTLRRKNLKTALSQWKRIKCFPSTPRRRNLKTFRLQVILNLCLRKTRSGKSRDYSDAIGFEKLRFQNVFHPHENEKPAFPNSSGLKSVSEKLRFRDGLVWTVSLTVEIRTRF